MTLALNSNFARAHWDDRLAWLLHKQVTNTEIKELNASAQRVISSFAGKTPGQVLQELDGIGSTPLEKELFRYWKRNASSFAGTDLIAGFRQLTNEVEHDLHQGPAQTIAEIRRLQKMVLNRNLLSLDLTVDDGLVKQIKPLLERFLGYLPATTLSSTTREASVAPVNQQIRKRYESFGEEFPWLVSLPREESSTGAVAFTASFRGYDGLDRNSLLNHLAGGLFAGAGPVSFYMKTWESGLAYSSGVGISLDSGLITYAANRSPDLGSLLELVNSLAHKDPVVDTSTVDYLLSQVFSTPRSMFTFSQRGLAIAQDIRDGNPPDRIRNFSEAVLRLREDPDLLRNIAAAKLESICGVLLNTTCAEKQKTDHSIFFFVGSEKILSDAEKRLAIPKLPRVWPSDFWLP